MTASPLRIAAIRFLNPAPLMWDFEHSPLALDLSRRYSLHYTTPSLAADRLISGDADLGLVPIAALTPELAVVPGCTIASLDRVRSIQLVLRPNPRTGRPHTLHSVQTVAADIASRSSVAYAEILFQKFAGNAPIFLPFSADPVAMLTEADAALLIGDPALLALEDRVAIERTVGTCAWIDVAHAWREQTGLPWVAAVWAVRTEALSATGITAGLLTSDLNLSRIHGLNHIEDLVDHWSPRLDLSPDTIRHYLTHNIHYTLDLACMQAIHVFRQYAAEIGVLDPLPVVRLLETN